MAGSERDYTISIVTDHSDEDRVVRGHLLWPDRQPNDTYTVDVNGVLSIKLDEHFPVRPLRIVWQDGSSIGTESVLERCFGEEVTAAMIDTRRGLSTSMINFAFSYEQRLAIAELQIHSPSTPPKLKRSLFGIFSHLDKIA